MKPTDLNVTALQLPDPNQDRFLLCYGDGIGDYIGSKWGIMRYDGSWWSEGGTEISDKTPERWCYLE